MSSDLDSSDWSPAQVLRDAAEILDRECQNLPHWPGRTYDTTKMASYVAGVVDAVQFLNGRAAEMSAREHLGRSCGDKLCEFCGEDAPW